MKIIFFVEYITNFAAIILLSDVLDFLKMQKLIVEDYLDKKFSDRMSSFETCRSSLLRLVMAQQRSL